MAVGGTGRAGEDIATAFCTKCGAPARAGVAYCTRCGHPLSGGGTGRATSGVAGAAGAVASAAGAVAGATGVLTLPWQVISTGQSVDVRGLAKAAAPSLLAMAPRPNLRWPAAGIAVTLAMDLGTALVSGGAVNVPMLLVRLASGSGTAVLGLIAGPKAGGIRKLTGLGSLVFGAVQLVSLLVAAYQAIATPVTLLTLLPSIIAVVSGLVLSVSTAIAGLKK